VLIKNLSTHHFKKEFKPKENISTCSCQQE